MPPYLIMGVWAVLHALVAVLAVWRGGAPERTAIFSAILAWIASVTLINSQDWLRPQYAVCLVDALFFAALLWVVLRSRRLWAFAAAGFQLCAVVLHLTFAVPGYVSGKGYLAAEFAISLLVFTAICVGVGYATARGRAPKVALRD